MMANWFFQVPNYVLAAVMYSLLGRFLLSLFMAPDSKNYIFRAFVRITDPILVPVRFITPALVPHMLVIVFAALWTLVLRFALLLALADSLAPVATG
jgi:YggT family protein